MARKKIIYIIVEGPSDEVALGAILARIFDTSKIYVEIMRCDITTKTGNTPSNIISKIGNQIKKYAADNHYNKQHFQEIIHLVDTDGAYIASSLVVENLELSDHIYKSDRIEAPNAKGIIDRNIQKSANMNKLFNTSNIWGLRYRVYYMSSNLDHVLHDKQNSTNLEKENDAYCFAKKYKNDTTAFLSYISSSEFSVGGNYIDSWNFIKDGANSLNRHTNLGIHFSGE